MMIIICGVSSVDAHGGRRRAISKPVEVEGIVIRLDANSLTIRTQRQGDVQVQVAAGARIEIGDQPGTLALIRLGDEVEVKAWPSANGLLIAVQIEVEIDDFEIEGIVKDVTPSSITITTPHGDLSLTIETNTVILVQGRHAGTSDIRVGDPIVAKALRLRDGSKLALRLVVGSESEEVEGTVVEVTPGTLAIRTDEGREIVLRISPETRVFLEEQPVPLSTLRPGMTIEAEVVRDSDGALLALVVEIDEEDAFPEIEGVIVSVTPSVLVVREEDGREVAISLTPETIVRRDEELISVSDLNPGDEVEVKVRPAGTGFIAVRVEVEGEDDDETEIEGIITAITGSALTIRKENGEEVVVLIDSATRIRRDDDLVDVSELRVGQKVEIEVRRNADSSLVAIEIEIETDDEVEVEGVVIAVSSASITVQTTSGIVVTFRVTAETLVRNGDSPASIDSIRPGDRVEIDGYRGNDGTLVAVVIELEADDEGDD